MSIFIHENYPPLKTTIMYRSGKHYNTECRIESRCSVVTHGPPLRPNGCVQLPSEKRLGTLVGFDSPPLTCGNKA